MRCEEPVETPVPPRSFLSPLPNLRVGSQLKTRRGVEFWVREAVVMVAQTGGESPSVLIERIHDGRKTELFLTVGMFANLTRGAMHRPGPGPRIDWLRVPRRPLTGISHLGLQQPPRLLRGRAATRRP
jgi:hypothetical protein